MKKAEAFVNIALWVAGLAALGSSLLVVDRVLGLGYFFRPTGMVIEDVPGWTAFSSRGFRVGPSNAKLTIVLFSDYQCPHCESVDRNVRGIQRRYSTDLSVVFRHFPLQALSREAAVAAECAGLQGSFLPFHDLLYAKRDSIGAVPWAALSQQGEIPNLSAFEECLTSGAGEERVSKDIEAARRLGGRGTPLMMVNERLLRGAPPYDVLEELVQAILAE